MGDNKLTVSLSPKARAVTTATTQAVEKSKNIQLADVTGLSVGMSLVISDQANSETKTIVSVNGDKLSSEVGRLSAGSVTVDSPLQYRFAAGATVQAKRKGSILVDAEARQKEKGTVSRRVSLPDEDDDGDDDKKARSDAKVNKEVRRSKRITVSEDELPTVKETEEDNQGFSSAASSSAESDADEPMTYTATEAERLKALDADLPSLDAMIDMLAKQPHFSRCARAMTEQVALQAKKKALGPGMELENTENGAMYMVIAGAVEVSVGPGPKRTIGKGATFNSMGMLGLYHNAEKYRPRRRTLKEDSSPIHLVLDDLRPYEVLNYSGPMPMIFSQTAGMMMEHPPDRLCFFNLCPNASPIHRPGQKQTFASSWMSMTIKGVERNPNSTAGGAILLSIAMSSLDDVRRGATTQIERDVQIRKAIDHFRENCDNLAERWRIVMSKCWMLFPEAPPEALFVIAEMAEYLSIEAGDYLVREAEAGAKGESIIVIEKGVAIVEKKVGGDNGTVNKADIGRLRAGAVIGDIVLIGAHIPRAASVRAKTGVDAIRLPAEALLNVLSKYPGTVSHLKDRIEATVALLQPQLSTRTEVLMSLRLFTACDLKFVNELANRCVRNTFSCGDIVMEEGSEQGTLYVLEYGKCIIETRAAGIIAKVPMGNCFGERTLLGISKTANATIRVETMAALVLALPRDVLHDTLQQYPEQSEHFERMKGEKMEGRIKGGQLAHIALFRSCSSAFIEALSESEHMRSYLPGQTVVVQGVQDDCQMFVLTGGRVAAEREGQLLNEMMTGATFGELAMLGFVAHRSVTIRALTFCFMLEISRNGFLRALEKYPDESRHFSSLNESAKTQGSVQWPGLSQAPFRFLYLLDLYTEHCNNQGKEQTWSFSHSAVLITHGYAFQVDEHGKHISTLRVGQAVNLQALVNSSDESVMKLQPSKECKACVLSREILGKVIAEFPEEQENVSRMIKMYLVEEACEKMSLPRVGSLRLSPIFRALSDGFLEAVQDGIDNRVYAPGSEIIGYDYKMPCLYVLLSGLVSVDDNGKVSEVSAPLVYGESILLGTDEKYGATVKALSVCIVQVLEKKTFDTMLPEWPDDAHVISQCYNEACHCTGKYLLQKALMKSARFGKSDPTFIRRLSEEAESSFFAPGELIIGSTQDGVVGSSPCYIILAGQVSVESTLGVSLDRIKALDVIGEAGAPGSDEVSSVSVCAWEDGLVYCARVSQEALEGVFEGFPEELDRLIELFLSRQKRYDLLERRRRHWLQETAVPALAQCPLFTGCSFQFLWVLAVPLCEAEYKRRQSIVVAGEPAHSMLIILRGSAELEAKSGEKVGRVRIGATIGEVAMFGLLPARTITVRALSECRVLEVTSQALRHAITGSYDTAGITGKRLRTIVRERQEQVAQGTPMTSLNIGATADDVSVRAIALHAKRMFYEEGQTWWPTPDSDSCGVHFSIVVYGRTVLEIAECGRTVMSFKAGSIIIEGMAAEFGANLRASSNCEVYQIRQADFSTAVASVPSAQQWLWRFKVLNREVERRMRDRLESARGLTVGLAPHPSDEEIHAWKTCRERSMRRARQMRVSDWSQAKVENLPRLTDTGDSAEKRRSDGSDEASDASGGFRSTRGKKGSGLRNRMPGLSSYPSFQLPMLKSSQSESRVSLGSTKKMNSKSLPSFRPLP